MENPKNSAFEVGNPLGLAQDSQMAPTQDVQDTARLGLSIKPLSEVCMEDFAAVVNPKERGRHCWCLSHRLSAEDITERGADDRFAAMRSLSHEPTAPGHYRLSRRGAGWVVHYFTAFPDPIAGEVHADQAGGRGGCVVHYLHGGTSRKPALGSEPQEASRSRGLCSKPWHAGGGGQPC